MAMILVGIVIVIVGGEIAKYVMPDGILYFLLVNKIYILAAALFLLLLGIDKVNVNSARNMTALFVLLIFTMILAWQLDKVASGILWNGAYPSVYGRIPDRYVTLALQAIDVIAIAAGALGAFLMMLKVLDMLKDVLTGQRKPKEALKVPEQRVQH